MTRTPTTLEIDWLNPTPLPAPSHGMEYTLKALDRSVHVTEGGYPCRAVCERQKTVIRSGGTVSAEKPGTKVELGPERPNSFAG